MKRQRWHIVTVEDSWHGEVLGEKFLLILTDQLQVRRDPRTEDEIHRSVVEKYGLKAEVRYCAGMFSQRQEEIRRAVIAWLRERYTIKNQFDVSITVASLIQVNE